MADKRCPNYYAKKKLFKKEEEESYCESASRYNSLGNFGGLGEPADHNPCLCSNY